MNRMIAHQQYRLVALLLLVGTLICSVDSGPASATPPQINVSPNDIAGGWHYRSFLNESKPAADLNKILFGEGDFVLDESATGVLSGTGDFGGGDTVRFEGTVSHGNWITVRFHGVGTGASNKDWLYDYVGVLVPQWSNGIDQVQTLVGSVVRTAPHSNGSGGVAAPGRVASFIAVKK